MSQNILFTCAGRRNYLINYFKEALKGNGNVIAADQDVLAPALVDADIAIKVPDIYDDTYIPKLVELCKAQAVTAIITLNDLELPLLAAHKSLFEDIGVKVIVSNEQVIDIGFDKLKTFNFIKALGIPTPNTYTTLEDAKMAIAQGLLKFPLVLKPRWGSASIGIEFPESMEELELSYKLQKIKVNKTILGKVSKKDIEHAILIQEKLDGKEFGLDIVNDFEGQYFGTFAREKLSMRSGETDKAMSVIDSRIEEMGKKIATALQHLGNMDCDAFLVNGLYYLLELNPRFGGGYPFSHEAGVNLAAIYLEWLKGESGENVARFNNYQSGIIFSKCDRLLKIENKKTNIKGALEIITSENDWKNYLKKVGNYDFYHTYNYHMTSKAENKTPLLLKYEENDVLIAIPLLVRKIPNTKYVDATSVYGYAGPISKGITATFDPSNFNRALMEYFSKNNYVSVFSRLNPFIENQCALLSNLGIIQNQGKIVNIDLNLSLEDQRSSFRNRLKTHINKSRRLCTVRKAETIADIKSYIDIYHENMDRVKAKKLYYFDEAYFENLLKSTNYKSTILLAIEKETGQIIAGSMFFITNGIVQYHLSGTKNGFLHLTPTKLLIDEMRIIATNNGCKFFNLGGGLGGRDDDSLFDFKSSFSKDFKEFKLWKYIVKQDVYDDLVAKKGVPEDSDFFPLYRSLNDLNINL